MDRCIGVRIRTLQALYYVKMGKKSAALCTKFTKRIIKVCLCKVSFRVLYKRFYNNFRQFYSYSWYIFNPLAPESYI